MLYPNHQPYHNAPLLLDRNESEMPHEFLHAFFDYYGFPHTMHYLHIWFNTAFAYRRLNRRSVLEILDVKPEMVRLLEAASLLADDELSDVPPSESNLFNPRWFCDGPAPGYTVWDYFPRHLSEQEYRTPYLVLEECTAKRTLPEWRSIIDDLFDSACHLSINGETHSGVIHQVTNEDNILARSRQLLKLVEASHLILVRREGKKAPARKIRRV